MHSSDGIRELNKSGLGGRSIQIVASSEESAIKDLTLMFKLVDDFFATTFKIDIEFVLFHATAHARGIIATSDNCEKPTCSAVNVLLNFRSTVVSNLPSYSLIRPLDLLFLKYHTFSSLGIHWTRVAISTRRFVVGNK